MTWKLRWKVPVGDYTTEAGVRFLEERSPLNRADGDQGMSAQHWFTYRGTEIFNVGDTGAYNYKTRHVEPAAGGCPGAYHPAHTRLHFLPNAGLPHFAR